MDLAKFIGVDETVKKLITEMTPEPKKPDQKRKMTSSTSTSSISASILTHQKRAKQTSPTHKKDQQTTDLKKNKGSENSSGATRSPGLLDKIQKKLQKNGK